MQTVSAVENDTAGAHKNRACGMLIMNPHSTNTGYRYHF